MKVVFKCLIFLVGLSLATVIDCCAQSKISLAKKSFATKPFTYKTSSDSLKTSSDSVEISVKLKIDNLKEADSITVRYGGEKGDLILMKLKHVFINGYEYLQFYEELFPVVNGNEVELRGVGSKTAYLEGKLMDVTVKDMQGNKVKIVNGK